jgi:hypothetical protein
MYFLKGTVFPVSKTVQHQALGAVGVVAATGGASDLAGAEESAAAAVPGDAEVAGAEVPPPLKSVAYHPEPFNWNPAAVSCFLNAGWEQDGHTSSGASDIFCNTSLANPQDSHL